MTTRNNFSIQKINFPSFSKDLPKGFQTCYDEQLKKRLQKIFVEKAIETSSFTNSMLKDVEDKIQLIEKRIKENYSSHFVHLHASSDNKLRISTKTDTEYKKDNCTIKCKDKKLYLSLDKNIDEAVFLILVLLEYMIGYNLGIEYTTNDTSTGDYILITKGTQKNFLKIFKENPPIPPIAPPDSQQTSTPTPIGYNKIWFGAPGTGKSYKINQIIKDKPDQVSRVVFYPDYSNAQFVGSYKPSMNGDKIQYKFVPGPFLRILVEAIKNPNMPYYMIIEEINRANAAAVFGDMFQLLDRKEGKSEYEIDINEDILSYLDENKSDSNDLQNIIDKEKLYVPKNLYIWATMNPADQGVFPLDTAFKRRWDFEYVPIDPVSIDSTQSSTNQNTFDDIFKNKILMYLFEDIGRHKRDAIFKDQMKTLSSLFEKFDNNEFTFENIFKNQNSIPKVIEGEFKNFEDGAFENTVKSEKYDEFYVKLKQKYYIWNNIRKYINEILSNAGVNEDKQLGFWFISRSVFLQKKIASPSITPKDDQAEKATEISENPLQTQTVENKKDSSSATPDQTFGNTGTNEQAKKATVEPENPPQT